MDTAASFTLHHIIHVRIGFLPAFCDTISDKIAVMRTHCLWVIVYPSDQSFILGPGQGFVGDHSDAAREVTK